MKKAFKIIGFSLLVIIILLITAPFIFEAQLKDMVKKTINKNVDATVEFSDLDLTLFRSFPQATLVLKDLSIINKAPFAGDTLAVTEELLLEMSIKELFKGGDEPKKIDELILNNAFVNIKVDSLGNNNYDIAIIDSTNTNADTTSNPFKLDLKHYEINNSKLKYVDDGNKMALLLENLDHQGTGDFSLAQSELNTETNSLISLDYDGTNYLNKNKLALDAIIQMDLDKLKYTFLENQATLNQLPLTFNGYVQVNENNNEVDISFKTPSSSFKNFLAVIPETYAKNIENVETNGDFVVSGIIKGIIDDTYIPKMDIKISSSNASFKYPDLPKSVDNIDIDVAIINETGLIDDTFLDINKMSFRIDEDTFSGSGNIKNLTGNMLVDMAVKGTINLANLEKAYPLELQQDLNGILTADLKTSFDMNSIEKEQYQNVNSSGVASIKNFSYKTPEIPNEVKISSANFKFNQGNVQVPELLMTTGKTDMNASGSIQNLMGYLFTDQQLKGDFKVRSNTFSVNDFMIAETKDVTKTDENGVPVEKPKVATTGKEAIKIPSFLDATLAFNANTVLYDNLELKNVVGTMIIKDETATLQNVTSNIFDGSIALSGNVSTKNAVPTFSMDMGLNALDISKSFEGLELLQNLAPIAKALQGKIQTQLNLSGNLNDDFTPQLSSLAGQALAQILTAKVNPEQMALLSQLDEKLGFIDFNDINLDNLKGRLTFNDGSVDVEPFDFIVKGIKVTVAGNHSFDNIMDYKLTLDVPAKMLGSEIGNAISKLSAQDLQNTTVAIPIGLRGNFQSPQINLNMQQAISGLTQQIIAQQKKELTNKGIDALGNILTGQNKQTPKTTVDSTGAVIQTTPKDTLRTQQQQQVKDVARDILGGFLKKKTTQKDTTKVN
ncbi:AsmA-like C-terminal region-containing protein [Gillisia hiemivivida]|uniref:AsmA family protein n=1 Tax=Gillisia hiemivivida TaxID=291190 RepID=A0A5C6ZXI8_9FLAO|nr:AsmA-like C-terminal region-containing protein [Gillisia hiemivivida]TXD94807.1 AsmA family protein [Gillisia hiemivivida]